jgi:hypothetical protein
LWSPAGHRAVVVRSRRESERGRKEGNDRQGHLVSERGGMRTRVLGWALLGRAQGSERARESERDCTRLGRTLLGRAGGRGEAARVEFVFFFFKNINSVGFCLFH